MHSSFPILPLVCHLSHISTSISTWNHNPKLLETTHVCWPQLIFQLNLLCCFYHCITLFVSRASQVCFYLELLHTLFLLVGKHCPRSFWVCSFIVKRPERQPPRLNIPLMWLPVIFSTASVSSPSHDFLPPAILFSMVTNWLSSTSVQSSYTGKVTNFAHYF